MSVTEDFVDSIEAGWHTVTEGTTRTARGVVAGCIAGAIASWVMNQYQVVEAKPVAVRKREPVQPPAEPSSDDATVKAAAAVSAQVFDHDLTDAEKKIAGPAVHYGFGAIVGGLYGGLAELLPGIGMGLGVPYATAVWLAGDEVAVPALGLSKPPSAYPVSAHASSLASHFVYGVSLDIGRRILRHLI